MGFFEELTDDFRGMGKHKSGGKSGCVWVLIAGCSGLLGLAYEVAQHLS